MSAVWQDVAVAGVVLLALAFLYRHFRPRRRKVVAVIPAGQLKVRPRTSSEKLS